MPTWKLPRPTPEQARETLGDWAVFETPAGARHVAGCVHGPSGHGRRVTSAIQSWDPATATFTTSSGRRQQLHGGRGLNLDGEYVYRDFLAREQLPDSIDVSASGWSQIAEAGRLYERGFLRSKR